MINNTQQQNTNDFGILANFTRSFDNYHNENDRIHLISSICLIKENEFIRLINLFKNKEIYSDEIFYIFVLSPSSSNTQKVLTIKLENILIV